MHFVESELGTVEIDLGVVEGELGTVEIDLSAVESGLGSIEGEVGAVELDPEPVDNSLTISAHQADMPHPIRRMVRT